jgi:cytochrome b pre-mRNA-processing protein 3
MGLINSFRAARRTADVSNTLYVAAVEQARSPTFFVSLGVPDTVDGRFDLIIIHIMLLVRRLRHQGEKAADINQALLNLMFADMDRNLREMGVGDLSVGRQVKKMAKAFYGRAEAWEAALDKGADDVTGALAETVYRAVETQPEAIACLASYVMAADTHLAGQTIDALVQGAVDFPAPQHQKPAA